MDKQGLSFYKIPIFSQMDIIKDRIPCFCERADDGSQRLNSLSVQKQKIWIMFLGRDYTDGFRGTTGLPDFTTGLPDSTGIP